MPVLSPCPGRPPPARRTVEPDRGRGGRLTAAAPRRSCAAPRGSRVTQPIDASAHRLTHQLIRVIPTPSMEMPLSRDCAAPGGQQPRLRDPRGPPRRVPAAQDPLRPQALPPSPPPFPTHPPTHPPTLASTHPRCVGRGRRAPSRARCNVLARRGLRRGTDPDREEAPGRRSRQAARTLAATAGPWPAQGALGEKKPGSREGPLRVARSEGGLEVDAGKSAAGCMVGGGAGPLHASAPRSPPSSIKAARDGVLLRAGRWK